MRSHREPILSRENAVILASMAIALPVAYLVYAFADVPLWADVLVLLGVVVILPTLVNEHMDRHGTR